jgi:hypothetical protein
MAQPELVGGVPAHRVPGDHGPVRVDCELRSHPRPHFPHVKLALVEVPTRRATRERRDHDGVALIANLSQEPWIMVANWFCPIASECKSSVSGSRCPGA